jgi:hypothetical protein
MEHLLDDFLVRDLVVKDSKLVCQRCDAEAKVLHTFAELD